MKTLLVLRHAKASRDDPSIPDHDRPLKPRGKSDAKHLGHLLREADLTPDYVISSSALRARKTAGKVAKQTEYPRAIELTDSLYLASPAAHLGVVRALPTEADCVLLVGHNPGISEFVNELTHADTELATCQLAQIELAIESWAKLTPKIRGILSKLWRPESTD